MYPRRTYDLPLPAGRTLRLGDRTLVMAIVNVTPDSFADGGVRFDPDRAVADGLQMLADGADILDVGGESTRPGAEPLPLDEELRRVLPVVEGLAVAGATVSVDTYKAVVAREAVARGAVIINDISALQFDPAMAEAAATTGAALVLMHNRGRSTEMYARAVYRDVAGEITSEIGEAIRRATDAGVSREALIVDPGFGFSKRAEHTYDAMVGMDRLAELDRPILAGPSRKSFLKLAIGERQPDDREWATAAAVTASVLFGAHIVRVHGVAAMADVVRVADRIRGSVRL